MIGKRTNAYLKSVLGILLIFVGALGIIRKTISINLWYSKSYGITIKGIEAVIVSLVLVIIGIIITF